MENIKKHLGLIIFLVILIILFIPIILDYISKQKIETITTSTLEEKISQKETFILYAGDNKDSKKKLKNIKKSMANKSNDYSYSFDIYNIENNDETQNIIGTTNKYVLFIEGDIQKTYKKDDFDSIKKDIEIFVIANITDDNKSYKVASSYKTYKNLIESDNVVMSVFGRDSCYFCNMFKPVYNAVANKYNIDIYYFNSDGYDKDEYEKIVNLDLTVPAKCNSKGVEFKLSEGFGTPLTLYTKNGKIIDCISGYVDRQTLVEKLKNVKMISE